VTPEPPLDPAQRRREITWFVALVVTVAAILLSAPWWAGLLDYALDPITAVATVVIVTGGLFASRGRRGIGWTALRLVCGAAIVLAIAMAVLVAGCVASECFN
jgi:hypothetical protein